MEEEKIIGWLMRENFAMGVSFKDGRLPETMSLRCPQNS